MKLLKGMADANKSRVLWSLAVAVAASSIATAAVADTVVSRGGITIKSADGNFEAAVGGRIHFDASLLSPDDGSALGISDASNRSGFFFRRAFLTLKGKLYGFDYHLDEDFSDTKSPADGLRNVWFAHALGSGGTLYVGQHKPWRSLDELASSNNTPLQERNVLSANGILGGRNYTQGLFYKWNRGGMFAKGDALWLGASLYSDTRGGKGGGRGFGANGRVAYAPIAGKAGWLHFGLNYSYDTAAGDGSGFGPPKAGYSTWYGKQGNPANVARFGNGHSASAGTAIGEIAGAYGPIYLQGEYGVAHLQQQPRQADILAYSVTIAWAITGETRGYGTSDATYKGLTPRHSYGAVELALRYDDIKNKDLSTCALSGGASSGATRCEVSSITAGINYYLNPDVRFLLDYQHGQADAGAAGKDSPDVVEARAQIVW
ncbi:MAG: hypothetical protein KGJ55_08430 [Gammaproteobacteria bacterium]|nr:hypothetical protein [Gammaproteobacteria bacterium]